MNKERESTNKQWLINHNIHQARMKKRFREIKKRKRKLLIGKNKAEIKMMRLMDQFHDYSKLHAPKIFSLIKNPSETIEFISKLEEHFSAKRKEFENFNRVE